MLRVFLPFLIGLALMLLAKRRGRNVVLAKRCPGCDEWLPADARVCWFCGWGRMEAVRPESGRPQTAFTAIASRRPNRKGEQSDGKRSAGC
jgi:hypothetical protein